MTATTTRQPTRAELTETIYRLDGPLRWALGEVEGLLRRAGVSSGMTVVDLGAGTGYAAIPTARAVGSDGAVYCVDTATELLDVLTRKAEKAGLSERIHLVEAGATSLPIPDNQADLAITTYVLHELADEVPTALAELYRVLRPTGRLVIADYRRTADARHDRDIEAWYARQADGAGPAEQHLRFTLADMETMLRSAGFHQIQLSTWHDFHLHAIAVK